MLWRSEDLTAALGVAPRHRFAAAGVAIDSREVQPGDLFVALAGARDGHEFVQAALDRGAAGALIRKSALNLPADAPVYEVDDPLEALGDLARYARARFRGQLFAVTGSVGKTTSKEMLRTALGALGSVHAAQASFNNHLGVPLTLARLPPEADFAVIEIGMNHQGEILPLARLSRPDVGIITNIGAAHIGHMGSTAAIAAEKADLFTGMEPGGVAVMPLDTLHPDILESAAHHALLQPIPAGRRARGRAGKAGACCRWQQHYAAAGVAPPPAASGGTRRPYGRQCRPGAGRNSRSRAGCGAGHHGFGPVPPRQRARRGAAHFGRASAIAR